MMSISIDWPPFSVWFQSIPIVSRKKEIIPTVGLKRNYQTTAAATGATA